MVKIGKQAENDFIGVNSGIMDQFAIRYEADQALLLPRLNTFLEYDLPLDARGNVVVIMNTNKRRGVADSKYGVVPQMWHNVSNSKKLAVSKHLVSGPLDTFSVHTATD